MVFGSLGIGIISILLIIIIAGTLKNDGSEGLYNSKNLKIMHYDCELEEDLKDRLSGLYDSVKKSDCSEKNYYSIFRKTNEVVIIAVIYVNAEFDELEYINFVNNIPEVTDNTLCHTLIVIFVEEENSVYMSSIMNMPEYYPLRDTIVFSVYDKEKKQVTVNKTNCGTGFKAYNDVIKVLNQIFFFKIEQTDKRR